MNAASWAAPGNIGRMAGTAPRAASAVPPASGATGKNLRMKAARVASDLSQADLAAAVGATRQTIGLIEAGGYNPSLKLCIAICKALGCTLDDLFWEEGA
ncbi:helix-turn-helix transcriptional regulator [Eggerthella timonensis]|uniref:helix-turn-helix transcriptional regulator n=1 Tax=Eggerthella timonensis TaxID=1871008 RepID=UPI001FE36571|nr:helix-turn-helix transcriptional regulator [Eggerthella timonensis]